MERLKIRINGIEVYAAGLPYFGRNFSRDSLIAGILRRDPEMLRRQISFSAQKQGTKKNPFNGEEPGKIHHEFPAVINEARGVSTEFNACDVTALWLIALREYKNLTGDRSLIERYRRNIAAAADYIQQHLDAGLFFDDPKFCGSDTWALDVTYWKDSIMIGRKGGRPLYPVVFTLAHIINSKGLESAAEFLGSSDIKRSAETMIAALGRLWDEETGNFLIAQDRGGAIRAVSSDSLHALFYLDSDDIPAHYPERIVESSRVLESPAGYRTLDPGVALEIDEGMDSRIMPGFEGAAEDSRILYHTRSVWPFEQAMIHGGAKKFGLERPLEVTSRVMSWLEDTDTEYFILEDGGKIKKAGCDPQLWTIAAKHYFRQEAASN